MQIVVHSLMVGNLRVGYRLDIGNDVCDVSSSIFESFYSNISKKELFARVKIYLCPRRVILMYLKVQMMFMR